MKPKSIKVGDKFIKPKVPNIVWIVNRLVNLPGLPPHAELKVQGNLERPQKMMMSLGALTDPRMFHRIEDR